MNQLEDMQTFVRIVEAGSITKAAEQLNTVKSAISRRLSELEKRLDVTLLSRTTRSQTLTNSGKSYYQLCLRIIDDVAEAESSVRNEHSALAGRIKIAAPLSFGLSHLSQALLKFNEMNPDIYFDVDFNDRLVDIVEEGFDLAIRIRQLEDSTLIAKPLFTGRDILCASPDYLKNKGLPIHPSELKNNHKKLHYNAASEEWHFIDEKKKSVIIKIPSLVTANNGEFLCQAAISGKGVLFVPDFICYKAIRLGQLKPLLCDYLTNNKYIGYALYPQTRHLSQRVRSLVDYLAQYFGDKPYWSVE